MIITNSFKIGEDTYTLQLTAIIRNPNSHLWTELILLKNNKYMPLSTDEEYNQMEWMEYKELYMSRLKEIVPKEHIDEIKGMFIFKLMEEINKSF